MMMRPDFGRIRWRLLAANLAVAGASIVAATTGIWLAAPAAFENAMGMGGGMGGMNAMMDPVLRAAFGDAIGTALLLGLGAAVLVAVVVALVLSARISHPLSELAAASQRVSRGDYTQRVSPGAGEVGELAASFNEMAATLGATEQRRLDLVGDVAHELRTPIASIRGYVEGLQAGVFEAGPETWTVLDEQTGRLARLVDDLSTLWRAESRDLRLDLEALDSSALLNDALERNLPYAKSRAVSLELGAVKRVTVRADRTRLAQVLDNLVGNGIRYCQEGGRVELDIEAEAGYAAISVRDDGPGLAPDQAARIFDRFYRADSSRSREAGGSGLGLTITKSLVEAMGGSIAVTSPGPGLGATFTVRLPTA